MSLQTRLRKSLRHVLNSFMPEPRGSRSSRSSCSRRHRTPGTVTPRLEPLEDRRMLSVTLFVDADAPAGGNGLGWASAYDNLQSALESAAAFNGDQIAENDVDAIWIAQGVYKPTAELEPGDARSATFSLVDGVNVYGGFAGTETALEERPADLTEYETVLSGDMGTRRDTSDNAYTIVYCGEEVTAAIDGTTITLGNADGDEDPDHPERTDGAGVYVNSGTLTLDNVTLLQNTAEREGGGLYNYHGTVIAANSEIVDNDARYGAGIRNYGSLSVSNSLLAENSATQGGGIMHYDWSNDHSAYYDVELRVTNCTFVKNSGPTDGDAVYTDSESAAINNSIFWQNGKEELFIRINVDWSHNLIGVDPLFVDFDGGDYRLTASSPAIEAGDNGWIDGTRSAEGYPEVLADLDGAPRLRGTSVDIGAYEYQDAPTPNRETPSTTVTTAEDVFDMFDGRISLREAVYYASHDATTTVSFDPSLNNTTITLSGDAIYVAGKAVTVSADSLDAVTIDGNGESGVFVAFGTEEQESTLSGLTITGGRARRGGGVFHPCGVLTVADSTISNNTATSHGGGLYNLEGTMYIVGCAVTHNTASRVGGGVDSCLGTLSVRGSVFAHNESDSSGGAIHNLGGRLDVVNSTIVGNSASYGGGICTGWSSARGNDSKRGFVEELRGRILHRRSR